MLTKLVPVVAAVTFALALATFALVALVLGLYGLIALVRALTQDDSATGVVFGVAMTNAVVACLFVLLLVTGAWLTRRPKLK